MHNARTPVLTREQQRQAETFNRRMRQKMDGAGDRIMAAKAKRDRRNAKRVALASRAG